MRGATPGKGRRAGSSWLLWAAALLGLCPSAWALPAAPAHYAVAARTPLVMTLTGLAYVNGAPAGAGVEVAVRDPQGVLCGASGVDAANAGAFVVHIYGDDPTTAGDEGMTSGDALRFEVWDAASETVFTHAQIAFRPAPFGTAPPAYPPLFADRAAYTLDLEAQVATTNQPPVLAAIGSKTVDENTTLSFTVSATDPDGDSLTYAATGLPTGATFNSATRTFSWTPDAGQAGTYPVTFTATDAGTPPLSDSETVAITVNGVASNQPPVLAAIGAKSGTEGALLSFVVSATDPENAPLGYSAAPLPAGASFNPTTRTFTWTPGYEQAGRYTVTFTVSDGSLADSEAVVIDVANVNRPPVFSPIGSKTVAENATLEFPVSASDPDGDALVYSATGLPAPGAFDPATRTFSWTPTYEQAGSYTVTFTVTDGSLPVSQAVSIAVSDVNRAPLRPTIASIAAVDAEPLSRFAVGLSPFSDPDANDALTAVVWEIWDVGGSSNAFRVELPATAPPSALAVPLGVLEPAKGYEVFVAYRDRAGALSPVSDPVAFDTAADPLDADGDGVQDSAEVAGVTPPAGTFLFQDPATGARIELKPPAEVTVSRFYVTDPADLPPEVLAQLPPDATIPYGLYSFRLEVPSPGASASVAFTFPDVVSSEAAWYKIGPDGKVTVFAPRPFSADGRTATLTLQDGGAGDGDGVENGVIVDPSGPVVANTTVPPRPEPPASDSASGGGGGGGCFLGALGF